MFFLNLYSLFFGRTLSHRFVLYLCSIYTFMTCKNPSVQAPNFLCMLSSVVPPKYNKNFSSYMTEICAECDLPKFMCWMIFKIFHNCERKMSTVNEILMTETLNRPRLLTRIGRKSKIITIYIIVTPDLTCSNSSQPEKLLFRNLPLLFQSI